MKDKGLYIIQCEGKRDYERIMNGGPWIYRQDLVLVAECASQDEADESRLTQAEIWVQFHNLKVQNLTEEGVAILTELIGIPLSEPISHSHNGRSFLRIKMLVPTQNPVKDKLKASNEELGDAEVFLVYEKVGRICCYCGMLGHDIAVCSDRARLAKLKAKMTGRNRPEMDGILKPTRGQWITDQTLIPFPDSAQSPKTPSSPSQQTEISGPEPMKGVKRSHQDLLSSISQKNRRTPLQIRESPSPNSRTETTSHGEEGEQNLTRLVKAARPSAMAEVPPKHQ